MPALRRRRRRRRLADRQGALTRPTPSGSSSPETSATNAIGTLTIDPGDASGDTIYAGTGEPNASADSEAGVGIYKSTDGGRPLDAARRQHERGRGKRRLRRRLRRSVRRGRCTRLQRTGLHRPRDLFDRRPGQHDLRRLNARRARRQFRVEWRRSLARPGPAALRPLQVDGRRCDVHAAQLRGDLSQPDAARQRGIVQASFGSTRGVNEVAARSEQREHHLRRGVPAEQRCAAEHRRGVWRSTDAGATWTQIKSALNPTQTTDRAEFAVNTLPNGKTRMYVGDRQRADAGSPARALLPHRRRDGASPAFADLTTTQNIGYCTAQCWYDNVVYSPAGAAGRRLRRRLVSPTTRCTARTTAGRGCCRPTRGATCSDLTQDARPNDGRGIHPDQHAIVTRARASRCSSSPARRRRRAVGRQVRGHLVASATRAASARPSTALCKSCSRACRTSSST